MGGELPEGLHSWPRLDPAPAVAFVDVDGTLLAETTTFLFAKLLRQRGLLGRSFLLRAFYHGLQHRFGRLDYGALVEFGLRNIATIPIDELERIAQENYRRHVRPRLFQGVVEHLADLRDRGTALVLVTSSPGIVVEPLRVDLGCVAALTTPVRIVGERLLGLADGPPCYGPGKLYWADHWAQGHGFRLDEAVAYADNWSDRELLGRVGHAIAVHPRGPLKELARARGWTMIYSRRPEI